jgi:hypothetical protein
VWCGRGLNFAFKKNNDTGYYSAVAQKRKFSTTQQKVSSGSSLSRFTSNFVMTGVENEGIDSPSHEIKACEKEYLNAKVGVMEVTPQHDEKRIMRQYISELLSDMIGNITAVTVFNDLASYHIIDDVHEMAIEVCNNIIEVACCAHEVCLIEEEKQKMGDDERRIRTKKKQEEDSKEKIIIYDPHLKQTEERIIELAENSERKKLTDVVDKKLNDKRERQLKDFYECTQREVDCEYAHLSKSISFVNSGVDFAKKVVIMYFETDIERHNRQMNEERCLFYNQLRARGLRRLERDEINLLHAQIYSRNRRVKKPFYFIQSDYFSLNLFNELKFFNTTKNDCDVNTLDSRLEVINPRKESNVKLNEIVNDITMKICNQLEKDWSNLHYSLQYTEEEELAISFDTKDLFNKSKMRMSDMALSRYMTNMAVTGVAAKAKLRPRIDRWRILEQMNVTTVLQQEELSPCPAETSPPQDNINHEKNTIINAQKDVLVFSFFVPLYNGDRSNIHGNRTMQQEIDAFNEAKRITLAKNEVSFANNYRDYKHSSSKKGGHRGVILNKNANRKLPPVRTTHPVNNNTHIQGTHTHEGGVLKRPPRRVSPPTRTNTSASCGMRRETRESDGDHDYHSPSLLLQRGQLTAAVPPPPLLVPLPTATRQPSSSSSSSSSGSSSKSKQRLLLPSKK